MRKPEKIVIPPAKQRAHRMLFDDNLPFRARREAPRTQYRRNPKHRNRPGDA
jgi:hypothetical protein